MAGSNAYYGQAIGVSGKTIYGARNGDEIAKQFLDEQIARQKAQQEARVKAQQAMAAQKAAEKAEQDRVKQLRTSVMDTALQYAQNKVAPTYAGTFEGQLSDIYNKIQNREQFKYDVNADPLYQNYKDKYVQQGKLAMRDTMGKAASLTGGFGSTYGQQVGQQTYDAYLQNLSDAIPELYGLAYDKYKNEGDELKAQYAMIGDQRDTEYNKYRDALSDFNYQHEVARQIEQDDYNRRTTEEREKYNRTMTERQQAYANLYALITASGYVPTNSELDAAGMTPAAAEALRNEFLRQTGQLEVAAGGGGGGGGGGRGGGGGGNPGGGGYTTADIAAGNSNAIAAAANGKSITNTSGGKATTQQVVDAIDHATNRVLAGSYAYTPNKNARNY